VKRRFQIVLLLAVGLPLPLKAKLPPELLRQLPPPAARKVDFVKDIQPIIEVSCTQCHARGKDKGGLSMETRAAFLKGGDSGAVVVPGKSAESYVIETISGLNPDNVMPQKGKKLTREQVALFRAWIDQGMPWPKEINFAKHEPANLKPARVAEPPARRGLENPVDRFVDVYFAKHKVKWAPPVDDRTFARRVWLDAIGLLPPPAELEKFLADKSPDKRAQLVQRLLADNQSYAEHWLTFWNDLLRNDYKGTGYIDGGRKQITGWLYTALARNLPYDQFVAQLVNPNAEAEGFTRGIVWRGAVNASMVPPMQAAQSISQVFLGVNLKCASCHDSFINEYTLKDAYGLAAVYADGPLEIAECDKPSGHVAQVKFLYGELGVIDGNADKATRTKQLAEVLTGKSNGRLSRTIVNRLWQRFLGWGLVEPVDEMDKPAWNPALLDWLAEDLVAHGYDLKHTMARILTSRAYQQPAMNLGEKVEDYVFRGPAVKRLSAEQFSDAVMAVAGMTYPAKDASLNRLAALGGRTAVELPLHPKWVWSTPGAEVKTKPASVAFRREVVLPAAPTEAYLTIAADNNYTLTINSRRVGASRNAISPDFYDVKPHLKAGTNVITVAAINLQPNGRGPVPAELTPESDNPAGLLVYARVRAKDRVMDFVSDASWTFASGRQQLPAVELGPADLAPWKLGAKFMETAAALPDTLPVTRAALLAADPLMVALGRPNREQVTTVRQSTATTLQALELTNGGTLAALLKAGAAKVLADKPANHAELVDALYLKAISRKPSASERRVAAELVGSPASAEGVEDLLWSLAMLPEFQLIY
jgi:mono/diheme cytochrome c family protein